MSIRRWIRVNSALEFVAKYTADGTVLWASIAASGGNESGRAIGVFEDGRSIVGITMNGTVIFNPDTENEFTVDDPSISVDHRAVLLAEFDADGTALWGKLLTGKGDDELSGILPLKDGTFWVSGDFEWETAFDGEAESLVEISKS